MPKVNQVRFEVEWCSKIIFDEHGDMIPDACEYSVRHFPGKGLAVAFARKLFDGFNGEAYPKLPFGCLRVKRQEARLDADMLEHEQVRYVEWVDIESCEMSSPQDEVEMERCSSR